MNILCGSVNDKRIKYFLKFAMEFTLRINKMKKF